MLWHEYDSSWVRVYPRAYGETCMTGPARGLVTVYPRAYGETLDRECLGWGSIPAPTGKPLGLSRLPIIPAPTGKPLSQFVRRNVDEDGLSPRLRGNLRHHFGDTPVEGSIPAPTGKPPPGRPRLADTGVYPRAYGETGPSSWAGSSRTGLSPRLRGNPVVNAVSRHCLRSIPAPTGKPAIPAPAVTTSPVYPRAYGETALPGRNTASIMGLSPRLRGNPASKMWKSPGRRSIPAPTGKPRLHRRRRRRLGVYPRAYGETLITLD